MLTWSDFDRARPVDEIEVVEQAASGEHRAQLLAGPWSGRTASGR